MRNTGANLKMWWLMHQQTYLWFACLFSFLNPGLIDVTFACKTGKWIHIEIHTNNLTCDAVRTPHGWQCARCKVSTITKKHPKKHPTNKWQFRMPLSLYEQWEKTNDTKMAICAETSTATKPNILNTLPIIGGLSCLKRVFSQHARRIRFHVFSQPWCIWLRKNANTPSWLIHLKHTVAYKFPPVKQTYGHGVK